MSKTNQRGDAELTVKLFIGAVVAIVLLCMFGLNIFKSLATHRNETITINKTERIAEDKSARYLVFTNKGVYENTDSFWNGKFNSSDLYNQLEAGKTYECDVIGWRNGFFSWYPNLISCEAKQ